MSAPREGRASVLRWLAIGVLCAGLALVGFMVVTEGEPGALPLGLVVLGVAGLVASRRRRPRTPG